MTFASFTFTVQCITYYSVLQCVYLYLVHFYIYYFEVFHLNFFLFGPSCWILTCYLDQIISTNSGVLCFQLLSIRAYNVFAIKCSLLSTLERCWVSCENVKWQREAWVLVKRTKLEVFVIPSDTRNELHNCVCFTVILFVSIQIKERSYCIIILKQIFYRIFVRNYYAQKNCQRQKKDMFCIGFTSSEFFLKFSGYSLDYFYYVKVRYCPPWEWLYLYYDNYSTFSCAHFI